MVSNGSFEVTELELESYEGDKTGWSKAGTEARGAGLASRLAGELVHYRTSAGIHVM